MTRRIAHTSGGRAPGSVALLVLSLMTLVLWTDSGITQTLYRWNDASGNPVVSDRPPPPGTKYTTVNARKYGGSPAGSRSSSGNSGSRPPASASSRSSATAPEEPYTTEDTEKVAEYCERAREIIFKLETFARIRVNDDDGTERFMSDEEREAQLAQARTATELHCED